MKRMIWTTLFLLVGQASAYAQPSALPPEGMVMVSPPLRSVEAGLVVQRLVHGRFERDGNKIAATLRFIGSSDALPPRCQPGDDSCLPNVRGLMTLVLHDGKSARPAPNSVDTRSGGEWTIDDPARDRYYYREMRELLATGNLDIDQQEGTWTLSGRDGVVTRWRPMSLAQASDAVYFVKTLRPSAFEIEQCVADQLAQIQASEAPTDAQTALLNAVSIIADKARARELGRADRGADALVVEFAAQLLSRSGTQPDSADAFVATPPFDAYAKSTGARAVLHDNFDRIAGAARYLRRLDRFHEDYAPDEQARVICDDLATLGAS